MTESVGRSWSCSPWTVSSWMKLNFFGRMTLLSSSASFRAIWSGDLYWRLFSRTVRVFWAMSDSTYGLTLISIIPELKSLLPCRTDEPSFAFMSRTTAANLPFKSRSASSLRLPTQRVSPSRYNILLNAGNNSGRKILMKLAGGKWRVERLAVIFSHSFAVREWKRISEFGEQFSCLK